MAGTKLLIRKQSFILIEILLALSIIIIISTVLILQITTLTKYNPYNEARQNLKTFLNFHKYKSMYDGKDYEIHFNDDGEIDTELKNYIIPINTITNDLKIIEYSSNKIVFYLDGSIDESYIRVSNNGGSNTYTLKINNLGFISEEKEEEIESYP